MSTLNVANVTDGTTSVPTGYVVNGSAKAWMTLVGDGTAIDASLNTSSVTDTGTGDYTQNYTNSFGDDSYSWVGQQESTYSGSAVIIAHVYEGKTTSATQLYTYSAVAGSNIDTSEVCSIVMGDLA